MVLWSLLPLPWLWFRLIDHLCVEWSVNPQYGYGYAVPFLCLLLWYRGLGTSHRQTGPSSPGSRSLVLSGLFRNRVVLWTSCLLLGFIYAPIRLVQEANPEWRLFSWALALDVIGLTFVLGTISQDAIPESRRAAAGTASQGVGQGSENRVPSQVPAAAFAGHRTWFPLLFFLVAVPWPTLLEQPLIQSLARANAAATVELISLVGIPALQHGNVIEVSAGAVGIDDACSGIRSLQANLMLSLFFGQFYALSLARRTLCVVAGFSFSFVFNVLRTALLTWVAARQGTAAIAGWHDPAGIGILVTCFLGLALLAKRLAVHNQSPSQVPAPEPHDPSLKFQVLRRRFSELSTVYSRPSALGIALCAWIGLAELGTELWYRSHESRLPAPVTWTIAPPHDQPGFRELSIPPRTRQLLRYDEALSAAWQTDTGQACQAIFLRWNPGRTAVYLARNHTPEVCLVAGGREVVSQSDLRMISVAGLQLPFRAYTARDASGPVHVFYCLWEDRCVDQTFDTAVLTGRSRLEAVFAGRRNLGQRSLEVALWGKDDDQQAEEEFERVMGQLVVARPLGLATAVEQKLTD